MNTTTTKIAGAMMTDEQIDTVSKALRRAWQLGQTYWQQADSESWTQQAKSDGTQKKFEALVNETRALLAASKPVVTIGERATPEGWECDLATWLRGEAGRHMASMRVGKGAPHDSHALHLKLWADLVGARATYPTAPAQSCGDAEQVAALAPSNTEPPHHIIDAAMDVARFEYGHARAALTTEKVAAEPVANVTEGCTVADAQMLREANHALAAENDMLRMRLRPFAQIAVSKLSYAIVEYHVEGDPEKQVFRSIQMQRAFNRAVEALQENLPVDCHEIDHGTHIEMVPHYGEPPRPTGAPFTRETPGTTLTDDLLIDDAAQPASGEKS